MFRNQVVSAFIQLIFEMFNEIYESVNFIHEWWDLQFKVDFERQIF